MPSLHERGKLKKEVAGLEHLKMQFLSQEPQSIEVATSPKIPLTLRMNTIYLESTSQMLSAALFF